MVASRARACVVARDARTHARTRGTYILLPPFDCFSSVIRRLNNYVSFDMIFDSFTIRTGFPSFDRRKLFLDEHTDNANYFPTTTRKLAFLKSDKIVPWKKVKRVLKITKVADSENNNHSNKVSTIQILVNHNHQKPSDPKFWGHNINSGKYVTTLLLFRVKMVVATEATSRVVNLWGSIYFTKNSLVLLKLEI